LELVHCHIAKQPTPLHDLTQKFHKYFGDRVEIMAKNAERRYLISISDKADLEECLRQWQSKEAN
jgi:hypothetical protein